MAILIISTMMLVLSWVVFFRLTHDDFMEIEVFPSILAFILSLLATAHFITLVLAEWNA